MRVGVGVAEPGGGAAQGGTRQRLAAVQGRRRGRAHQHPAGAARLHEGPRGWCLFAWRMRRPWLPLQGHDEIVWAVEIDGQRLFSASADKTIRVWDIASRRCEQARTLDRSCIVLRLTYFLDGQG